MIDAPAVRRLCRSAWARSAGVSLVVAVVITGMLGLLGAPIGATFRHALAHSLAITWLATWTLSQVMRRLRAAGVAVRWAALIPLLLGVAVLGTTLSCGFLAPVEAGDWRGGWARAGSSLPLNALLTATIGIAMVLYEAQRDRLDSLTLDLRTRQLEHERAKFFRMRRGTLVNVSWLRELHADFGGRLLLRLRDERHTELVVARDRVRLLRQRLGLP